MFKSYVCTGLVETSNNLASVAQLDDGTYQTVQTTRSSIAAALAGQRSRIARLAKLAGAKVNQNDAYPGWCCTKQAACCHALSDALIPRRKLSFFYMKTSWWEGSEVVNLVLQDGRRTHRARSCRCAAVGAPGALARVVCHNKISCLAAMMSLQCPQPIRLLPCSSWQMCLQR